MRLLSLLFEKLGTAIHNRPQIVGVVILLLIAHHTSVFEKAVHYMTDDIPPDCIYIVAEVVDKGRVEDGFGIHYLKIIGVAETSSGEQINNTRFKMYVSSITYSEYEVGEIYEELLCNSEDKEEFLKKMEFILNQDWFGTWDGGDFNAGWLYR